MSVGHDEPFPLIRGGESCPVRPTDRAPRLAVDRQIDVRVRAAAWRNESGRSPRHPRVRIITVTGSVWAAAEAE